MQDVPVGFGLVGVQDARVGLVVSLIQFRRGFQNQITNGEEITLEIYGPKMPAGLDL